MTIIEDVTDRARGALLGLAVGDALGAPVEFCQRGRFEPLTGLRTGGKFQMRLGEWTDDTAMALCLADSLLACEGFDPLDQMERYWRWGNEGYNSTRDRAFGVGKTVAKAMARFLKTGEPFSGLTDPNSAGNGSIMRLAPVVMFYLNDRKRAMHFAGESSRTTHQATEAIEACQLLAHTLLTCIHRRTDKPHLFDGLDIEITSPALQTLVERQYMGKPEFDIRGSGYVVESLEAALWAFETTDSFEQAVLAAANLGDDSDTTAAVCGQIAGAYYGYSAIPDAWLQALFEHERLLHTADALIQKGLTLHE